jgi:hypothetical protein
VHRIRLPGIAEAAKGRDATKESPFCSNHFVVTSITLASVLVLAGSTAMHCIGRTGKVFLLLAGMAGLLDLLDPERVSAWEKAARERLDAISRDREELRVVSILHDILRQISIRAATKTGYSTDYFSTEQFNEFTREALGKFYQESPMYRRFPFRRQGADPQWIAGSISQSSYNFLIGQLRGKPEAELLERSQSRFLKSADRSNQALGALLLLAVPISIWLVLSDDALDVMNPFVAFGVTFMSIAGILLFFHAFVFLSTRVFFAARRVPATVRLEVARIVFILIGPEDQTGRRQFRRLRLAALGFFTIGSLLDLVAS